MKKFLFLITLCIFFSCKHQEEETTNKKENIQSTIQKEESFKPEVIETFKVKAVSSNSKLFSSGTVQPSENGIANVVSPINGIVEKMYIKVGENVKNSTLLLKLKSIDVSDIKSGYLGSIVDTKIAYQNAKAQYESTQRIYNLNKELFETGAIPKNDFINSENNLKQAKYSLEGLEEKLKLYKNKEVQEYEVKAPISGTIYEVNVHQGDRVQNDPSNPLIKIVNENKIIVANIYDKDLSSFSKGKKVDITSDTNKNINTRGEITYISDVVDSETKTVKAYIKPENPSNLKLNMFVNISVDKKLGFKFKVPKKSVIYRDKKLFVLKKHENDFSPIEVKLIDDSDADIAIVSGLKSNDEIAKDAILLEKEQ